MPLSDDTNGWAFDEHGRPEPVQDFDYGVLDGESTEEDLSQFSQEEIDRALTVLRVLLTWVFQDGMKNADGLKIRSILICWIFLKELRPMTLTQMARGFGLKKQSLGRWVDDFKRRFKIRTVHMRQLHDE